MSRNPPGGTVASNDAGNGAGNGRPSGLTRAEAWLVQLASLAVGGTGVVYAVMRYLVSPQDPFAVVNHPWQPAVQHAHVLAAPLLVLAAGVLWRAHVRPSLRHRVAARRRSGWAALLSLAPMAATGYLLQVSVSPTWQTIWTVLHVATSLAWVAGYALHQVGPRLAAGEIRR